MEALAVVLCLALPALAGALALLALFAKRPILDSETATLAALGGGIGIGIQASLFFLAVELAADSSTLFWVAEMGSVLLGVGGLVRLRAASRTSRAHGPEERKNSLGLRLCLIVALVAAISQVYNFSLREWFGSWDAWSYWNMRAMGIVRGGSEWKTLLGPEAPFADYPMMLSSFIAGGWSLLGATPALLPRLTSIFFGTSLCALLYSSVAGQRGQRQALLATVVLLGTPTLVSWFASQTADAPYAFFLLASVVCAGKGLLPEGAVKRGEWAFCAGCCAGLACFTKNEGLVFLALLSAFGAAALLWNRQRKVTGAQSGSVKIALAFTLGAAPPMALMLLCKASSSHDYLTTSPIGMHEVRTLGETLWLCLSVGANFGNWTWNPLPLCAAYVLLTGWRAPLGLRGLFGVLGAMFGLTMAFYGGVYLLRLPAYNDIQHNLDRLIAQWWPCLLWMGGLAGEPRAQEQPGQPE